MQGGFEKHVVDLLRTMSGRDQHRTAHSEEARELGLLARRLAADIADLGEGGLHPPIEGEALLTLQRKVVAYPCQPPTTESGLCSLCLTPRPIVETPRWRVQALLAKAEWRRRPNMVTS